MDQDLPSPPLHVTVSLRQGLRMGTEQTAENCEDCRVSQIRRDSVWISFTRRLHRL